MTKQQQIYEFITTQLNPNAELQMDGDMNLLESGAVDSVAMIELVVWLEETYGITIPTEELLPENFSTLDAISTYVERAQSALA